MTRNKNSEFLNGFADESLSKLLFTSYFFLVPAGLFFGSILIHVWYVYSLCLRRHKVSKVHIFKILSRYQPCALASRIICSSSRINTWCIRTYLFFSIELIIYNILFPIKHWVVLVANIFFYIGRCWYVAKKKTMGKCT